jgi:signal transduction histidine kinase
MDHDRFDLASWIEGPQAERALLAWERERHTNLPVYRELRRDVARAHGRRFIAALAAVARGDEASVRALARRLVDEPAGEACSPAEVAAGLEVFQRAYRSGLAEAAMDRPSRERAERDLCGVLLRCANALCDALAAGLERARRDIAAGDAKLRAARLDRDQLTALVDGDLHEAIAATTSAIASVAPPDDAQARASVVAACRALDRLRDRAERLLEVERLEQDASLRIARARVKDLLASVARSWEGPARDRQIAIELEADGLEVDADAGLLERALDSYLENAVRHTPARGRIRLGARQEGERAVITVWDSGPPLHPDFRRRAFDKFWTSRGETGAGRGLGLYLTRLVAERHGGSAWTDDEHGCCAFHLMLPLAQAADAPESMVVADVAR